MSPSHNDTKAIQIMEAAGKVLANRGYMGTTINAVAQEAGVSRGLLHYYFKNKEEMLAKVLKRNMEISTVMITQVFDTQNSAEGFARSITSLLEQIMKNTPDFFHLFFEGYAVARHSKIVNDELSAMYGKFRTALQGCLETAKQQGIISPKMPLDALAAIITGIMDGMGLQLLTETELINNPDIWSNIETSLVDLLSG